MGMKKRLIAALIAGMMLIQTAACGNNARHTGRTAWIAQSQYGEWDGGRYRKRRE